MLERAQCEPAVVLSITQDDNIPRMKVSADDQVSTEQASDKGVKTFGELGVEGNGRGDKFALVEVNQQCPVFLKIDSRGKHRRFLDGTLPEGLLNRSRCGTALHSSSKREMAAREFY
jgi:hypothetical protein